MSLKHLSLLIFTKDLDPLAFQAMKLQDRKAHDEKDVAGHMTLLFQTVMQLLSLVGSNFREPNCVNTKDINMPSQKELERFAEQIEHALKENEELKSKLFQQEQRTHQLESGGAGRNEPIPNSSATDQESTMELSRRIHNEEGKTADLVRRSSVILQPVFLHKSLWI